MHLNLKQVLDLIDGTIDKDERPRLASHLQSCRKCTTELENWSALLGLVKRRHLLAAPPDTLNSGKRLFRKTSLDIRPSLRQIFATVVFDSFSQPAVAGVRAELALDEQSLLRQVILQAEEFDIRIRISKSEGGCDLLGQILPRRSRSFVRDANLYLRHGEERINSTNVNELGEFHFSDVPEGMLSLQIDLPTMTIIGALSTYDPQLG
jgi:hypothetical protein